MDYRYYEIDVDGFVLSDFALPQPGLALQRLPAHDRQLVRPKWVGNAWVEGYPLEGLKLAAEKRVDTLAGDIRAAYASPGEFVDLEYQEAEAQAVEYLSAVDANAGDPTGVDVPPMIQSAADYVGGTPQDGALDIVAQAGQLRMMLEAVRAARLAGKRAIQQATDEAGIAAAESAARTALGALAP